MAAMFASMESPQDAPNLGMYGSPFQEPEIIPASPLQSQANSPTHAAIHRVVASPRGSWSALDGPFGKESSFGQREGTGRSSVEIASFGARQETMDAGSFRREHSGESSPRDPPPVDEGGGTTLQTRRKSTRGWFVPRISVPVCPAPCAANTSTEDLTEMAAGDLAPSSPKVMPTSPGIQPKALPELVQELRQKQEMLLTRNEEMARLVSMISQAMSSQSGGQMFGRLRSGQVASPTSADRRRSIASTLRLSRRSTVQGGAGEDDDVDILDNDIGELSPVEERILA